MTPEQQRALAVARARLKIKARPTAAAETMKWQDQIRGDLTGDMSGTDKFLAGVGKGMTDLATGVGQRLGLVDQSSVDEMKKRDAPLMDTGLGVAGNVTGK